jgi:isoquinoline 1-oxidoreductase beta subunit
MSRLSALASRSRRDFLIQSGLAGAAFALPIPIRGTEEQALRPTLWLAVYPDGRIVCSAAKLEMGQGILTALSVLVAEELDVDPASIQVRIPSTDELPAHKDPLETSSSRSVASCWRPVRVGAACVREMLVAAAARAWAVPSLECRAEKGTVTHVPSGRQRSYGELASSAAREKVPESPRPKRRGPFRYIGRPTRRIEAPDVVRGRLRYGCDERREGMLFAVLARPPLRGGTLPHFDPAQALALPGVRHVLRIDESVAVVGETTWDAIQGRDALALNWKGGEGAAFTSEGFERLLSQALDAPKAESYDPARSELRAADILGTGPKPLGPESGAPTLTAEYATPFQAHLPMEPPNALAWIRDGKHEVWCGTQFPGEAVKAIAHRFGLAPATVVVHPMHMGGGFGRREVPDYVIEALLVARAIGGGPVQLFWTREDDLRHDYFHPATRHRLAARLEGGRLRSWRHRVVAPSIEKRWGSRPGQPSLIARVETAGAWNLPYAIPELLVEYVDPPLPIVPGFWRGIQIVSNVFAVESFIDELAHAAGRDPLEFRLSHLGDSVVAPMDTSGPFPLRRLRGVLDLAGARAAWGSPLPAGRGRGVAGLVFDGRTACACVAEVAVEKGQLRLERIVCAIDCGIVVNPLGLAGNAESAIAWGASALFTEVTFAGGIPVQTNPVDYPILRLSQMPAVEVHCVPSEERPSGTGEIPVPLVAPAVCNAIFNATGRRLRRLPIRPEDLA